MDRAALDVAIKLGLKYGGFCPKGRLAEDGIISEKYNLIENNSPQYAKRTLENVKIADGSLIIHTGIVSGGTRETIDYCNIHNKPFIEINPLEKLQQTQVNFDHWKKDNQITLLNVAGPRESEGQVYDKTVSLLNILFCQFKI